ncbi:flagellar filament capping protein FliD [bacterium]|nr:flagellar filament capping protein FliD [bacterium]
MSTVSFSGLASGMDTASLVSQLVELKRQPIYRLQGDRQSYETQISALGNLKSRLIALQDAAQNIDSANEFAALTGVSSHEDILTATPGSTAAPGTYDIVVDTLAQRQISRSQGYDNTLADVGLGTMTFTVGGEEQTLELTEFTTLQELADRINQEIDGVGASIIHDGSETGGYYLSLSGEPGSGGAFSVDTSGLSGGTPIALTEFQAATDAHLTVNGLDVYADGNRLEGVISGVTLDLHEASPGTTVNLSIETDAEGVKEQVKAFVDAYNDVMTFLDTALGSEGELYGNATARSIMTRVQNVMTASHDGDGLYSLMAEVGIERQQSGRTLEFDETRFADAIATDFSAVRDLFIGYEGNEGKAALFDTAIDDLTDSVSGMFKLGTESLNRRIDNVDSSIERYERSVENYRETLERKFVAMESMIAQLNAQGSSLNSMIFSGQ